MRNVGFVKVDAGEEACVVHIHGKGLRLEGEPQLTIYLFFERNGECIGIPQGVVGNVNPAINYQLRFTGDDVGEPANYPLIEGIIMESSSHRKYAAVWTDMPVNVDDMRLFRESDVQSEETNEPESQEQEEQGEVINREQEEEQGEPINQEQEEQGEVINREQEEEQGEPINQEQEEEQGEPINQEQEEEQGESVSPEQEEKQEEPVTQEPEELPGERTVPQEVPAEEEEKQSLPENTVEETPEAEAIRDIRTKMVEKPVLPDELFMMQEPVPCEDQNEPEEPEEAMCCQEQNEQTGQEEQNVQEEATPDSGNKRTCMKIQRKDIASLPRCEWRLSNNSFLLHGYYNYRHLVLIEENGNRWLGVPGIYHPKEAKAAEAFGFPQFVKAEELDIFLDDGEQNDAEEFGYWCRHVRR